MSAAIPPRAVWCLGTGRRPPHVVEDLEPGDDGRALCEACRRTLAAAGQVPR